MAGGKYESPHSKRLRVVLSSLFTSTQMVVSDADSGYNRMACCGVPVLRQVQYDAAGNAKIIDYNDDMLDCLQARELQTIHAALLITSKVIWHCCLMI